jgi:hypothetical protein
MAKSLSVIVCLLLAVSSMPAQQAMGSITGNVTDPQSAVIPGAVVVLTHVEANRVVRTSTNDTGYFEVNHRQVCAISCARGSF